MLFIIFDFSLYFFKSIKIDKNLKIFIIEKYFVNYITSYIDEILEKITEFLYIHLYNNNQNNQIFDIQIFPKYLTKLPTRLNPKQFLIYKSTKFYYTLSFLYISE